MFASGSLPLFVSKSVLTLHPPSPFILFHFILFHFILFHFILFRLASTPVPSIISLGSPFLAVVVEVISVPAISTYNLKVKFTMTGNETWLPDLRGLCLSLKPLLLV